MSGRGRIRGLGAVAFVVGMVGVAVVLAFRSAPAPVARPGVARYLGAVPAGRRIDFDLLLALPGHREMARAIAGVEDPASPSYRRFIAPVAFGRRFGLSADRLARLRRTLTRRGMRVLDTYPQRTELTVRSTAGVAERLFDVRLGVFRVWSRGGGVSGRVSGGVSSAVRFIRPLGSPTLPAALRGAVVGISGLDTQPQLDPRDVPVGGLDPSEAADAYDAMPLHAAGIEGQGQTIAVISFSSYDPSDPAAFATANELSGPVPQVVPVDGGAQDDSGALEANLDLDVIRGIAPGAQILVYEAPDTSAGYADAINAIVAQRRATIVSSSWGECEPSLGPGERQADEAALNAAVAAGISMFVATGDSGAYDCQGDDFTDERLSVDWPASSPDAIAVGGTRLYLTSSDGWAGETAWEDQLSDEGGGGGLSTLSPRPAWQTGPGVINRFSNGHRQVPDVSADADPGTPWRFYAYGASGVEGGTSAAAPFWAGAMLLIKQYAEQHGVAALGFVDPALYALAARHEARPPFHDIVRGGNRYYRATLGWDPATGLGSPQVFNLAVDLVAYLKGHKR